MQINWHATVQDVMRDLLPALNLQPDVAPLALRPGPPIIPIIPPHLWQNLKRDVGPQGSRPGPSSIPIIPPHLWQNVPLADVQQGQQRSVAEVAGGVDPNDGWAVREPSSASPELNNMWAGRPRVPRVQPHVGPKPGGQYGALAKAAAPAADAAAFREGPTKAPSHGKVRLPQQHLQPGLRLAQPMGQNGSVGHANEVVPRAAAPPVPQPHRARSYESQASQLHAAGAPRMAHPAAAQVQQLVQGQPQTLDAVEMPQVIAHLMGTNRAVTSVQGNAHGLVGSEQVLDQPFKHCWGARPDSVFFTATDLLGVGSFGTVYR